MHKNLKSFLLLTLISTGHTKIILCSTLDTIAAQWYRTSLTKGIVLPSLFLSSVFTLCSSKYLDGMSSLVSSAGISLCATSLGLYATRFGLTSILYNRYVEAYHQPVPFNQNDRLNTILRNRFNSDCSQADKNQYGIARAIAYYGTKISAFDDNCLDKEQYYNIFSNYKQIMQTSSAVEGAYRSEFNREYSHLKLNITDELTKSSLLMSRAVALHIYNAFSCCIDSLMKAEAVTGAQRVGVGEFGMLILNEINIAQDAKERILNYNFINALSFFEGLKNLLGEDKIGSFKIEENNVLIDNVHRLKIQFELMEQSSDVSTNRLTHYYKSLLKRIIDHSSSPTKDNQLVVIDNNHSND